MSSPRVGEPEHADVVVDPIRAPRSASAVGTSAPPDDAAQPRAGHSMWWMVACCAPMVLLVIAIALGVFGPT